MKLFVTDTLCVDIPIRSGIAVGFSMQNYVMHVADLTLQFPNYAMAHSAANAIADAVLKRVGSCSIRQYGGIPIVQ